MLNKIKNFFSSKKDKDVSVKEKSDTSKPIPAANKQSNIDSESHKENFVPNDLARLEDVQIAEYVNYPSLAIAFIKAIEQFGVSILKDVKIVNIVNDFKGYRDCPHAKSILIKYLDEDRLSQIIILKSFDRDRLEERILQQALKDATFFGYSQDIVRDIYVAILYALGRKDLFSKQVDSSNNNLSEESESPKPDKEEEAIDTQKEKFVFSLKTIPFSQNYLITRNLLCHQMNGQKISEYDFEDFKSAFFKADLNGKKDVEFNVQTKDKDNTTTEVICFYASNSNPSKLKGSYRDMVKYLDSMYGKPTVAEGGDVEAYLDWLNYWKENPYDESRYFLNIRAYILPEGTVCCSLQFTPNDYNLMFTLTPRNKEDKEKLQWRVSKPEPFVLMLPMSAGDTPQDSSYDNDNYADYDANYDDDNDVDPDTSQQIQIASTIACIISNTLQIPMEDIALDSSFIDLGMDSLDAVELIMELEKEFGIIIPDEDAMQIVTLWDAASCVKWHLDNY